MGSIILIRPKDDAASRQASDWGDSLRKAFTSRGHTIAADIDDSTPADRAHVVSAAMNAGDLICYFGHGDRDSWLTKGQNTLDATNLSAVRKKAIVSVACKTGCNLGPNAITAGGQAWLGFTTSIPIIPPHKTADPIGDAIADGLAVLSSQGTIQQARDKIYSLLDAVVVDHDTKGKCSAHPQAVFVYCAAMVLRDHVVVHGNANSQPLP